MTLKKTLFDYTRGEKEDKGKGYIVCLGEIERVYLGMNGRVSAFTYLQKNQI
jgi:hypothetical protein